MSLRYALKCTATVVIALAFIAFAFLEIGPLLRATALRTLSTPRPNDPSVAAARPPTVDALVSKLKTLPLLQEMNPDPTSCSRIPKGHPRYGCSYRSGDIAVGIAWSRRSQHISSVRIERSMPRGATPFAWADLANTAPALCPSIDASQAETIARDVADQLIRADWRLPDEIVDSQRDGATRATIVNVNKACIFRLYEHNKNELVQAIFYASPIEAN